MSLAGIQSLKPDEVFPKLRLTKTVSNNYLIQVFESSARKSGRQLIFWWAIFFAHKPILYK
jgi:hypothetical protein